jgi:O-antigen/teichoic acid export membrane protein
MDEPPAVIVRPPSFGVRVSRAVGLHEAGRALRDFLTYLPAQLLPAVAGAVALLLLPRRLLPTPYGILQLALSVITAAWVICGQWVTGAITRELPAARARGDLAGFSATLSRALRGVVLLFALFAIGLAGASVLSSAIRGNLLLILFAAAGMLLQNVAVTLYSASLRPGSYAVTLLASRIGGIALGLVLVYHGKGVSGYLFGIGIISIVVGTIALVDALPRVHATERGHPAATDSIRAWAAFGVPVGLSAFAAFAMLFADRFLLAGLRSTGAAGVYSLGATIGSQVVTLPTLAFMTGARPLAMKAYAEKGKPEVERLMRAWTRIVLLVAVPATGFLLVTAEAILRFGPGSQRGTVFFPAVRVVPIIAFGTTIFVLVSLASLGCSTARQVRPMIWSAAAGLVANIASNLVLIPAFGIVGAAISMPVGATVYLAVSTWTSRPYARWDFPFGTLVRTLVATGVAIALADAAIGWLFSGSLTQTEAGEQIGIATVIGAAAYAGALALLGELRHRHVDAPKPAA